MSYMTTEDIELLTVDELAALLRLSRAYVYQMIGRDEVPGVRRYGRCVRLIKSVVVRWIETGQRDTPRGAKAAR